MNEWMNEWMDELTNKYSGLNAENESIYYIIYSGLKAENKLMDYWMNEWMNEQITIQGWTQSGGRGGRRARSDYISTSRSWQVNWNNDIWSMSNWY